MEKTKVKGLKKYLKAFQVETEKFWVKEQTKRLIDYAERNIRLIGDAIQLYHSRKHMDRTGNLLDSLCWGVSYRGEVKGTGFYRKKRARGESYVHEWSDYWEAFPVSGHEMAANYLQQYAAVNTDGWRVFFAILAPYWGYWEEGFTFKGKHKQTRLQFAVMAEFYDKASKDLKPATTTIKVHVPQYVKGYTIKGKNGKSVRVKGTLESKWESWSKYSRQK